MLPDVIGTQYHAIADVLRDRILTGMYPAGTPLPSEQDLSVEYGCGRDTLRDALDVLRREGLIIKKRGRLATVAPIVHRDVIVLAVGCTVGARMAMRPELAVLGCRAETPILEVTSPGSVPAFYPADQVLLTVPS